MKVLNQIIIAVRIVLQRKPYFFGFLLLAPAVFFVFVLIPVFSIPGNSIIFQLNIFGLKDYLILSAVSLLSALFFILQVYAFFGARERQAKLRAMGQGAAGGYGGLVAALFGTASCTSCLASVFGFMGFGTILFIAKYQWFILLAAIGIMVISIYFTSKRILGLCASCTRKIL